MSVQVVVAVITAVVALLSALFSALFSAKTARLEQVMSRYRDPLLNAAFDLQSRVFNLITELSA